MLLSELDERGRRFKLALRAGIPVLLLVFLVFFTTISTNDSIKFTLQNVALIAAIVFITIYFIYFLMNASVQETLIDETTQVFNQKAFIEKLKHAKSKTVGLLYIDNISTLSRHYGDREVDLLLYTITQKLDLKFEQHGLNRALIGRRYGSDFLIALDENDKDFEAILNEFIEENTLVNNIEVAYKLAIVTNTGENFNQILFHLKDIIQSQHTPDQEDEKTTRTKDAQEFSDTEKAVIDSMKDENLLLDFRPVLNTHTNKIDIYEVAIKLHSDKMGAILPRVYLPIINRLGLGREYDLTITKHIIDLLPLINKEVSFTFNLSPFSLRDNRFQENFFAYLEEKNVDASRLIIQLYERKTHHNLSGYLKTLNSIRARGVRICIDNFGSSNASMEYMKHFKFDMIQFDRDYVTHLNDETSSAMLGSLTKMAKDLNIITVAKWVDKEDQQEKLKLLGIDYLQGFGIEKPISEDTLINTYN